MQRSIHIALLWLGLGLGALTATAASRPDLYDLAYADDTTATLNTVPLDQPQHHTIDAQTDRDWAVVLVDRSKPVSIKLTAVGAGLDPELWVYEQGLGKPPRLIDDYAAGAGETYLKTQAPLVGKLYLRVGAAAPLGTGPTSYTLTFGSQTGANNGLVTISSFTIGVGGSGSGRLSLGAAGAPAPARQVQPEGVVVDGPLYTQTYLAYQAGTFTGAPLLILGGLGDPINFLARDYIAAWQRLYPGNLTITRVYIEPYTALGQPLELGLQMRATPVTLDLSDGQTTWNNVIAQDIPAGAKPADVRIFHWNPQASGGAAWEVFDNAPQVSAINGGWLAVTRINALQRNTLSSDFFAAGIVTVRNSARDWWLY